MKGLVRKTNSVMSEKEMLQNEKNGVSVEGEFALTKAVGEFQWDHVRAGTIMGNYSLNLKDQLRMRRCGEEGQAADDLSKPWKTR